MKITCNTNPYVTANNICFSSIHVHIQVLKSAALYYRDWEPHHKNGECYQMDWENRDLNIINLIKHSSITLQRGNTQKQEDLSMVLRTRKTICNRKGQKKSRTLGSDSSLFARSMEKLINCFSLNGSCLYIIKQVKIIMLYAQMLLSFLLISWNLFI